MFRKRFNTILKLNSSVNSNIAEKMMAHKNGLDGTYLQPTLEECYREFLKAIPDLAISDEERINAENRKLRKEKSELEKKNYDIESLKEEIKSIKLRTEISDLLKYKMMEYAEKNTRKISILQAAKTNWSASTKFEELVNHYLKDHDGDISDLRVRIGNAQVTITEN